MKINEVIMREGYELRLERDKRANMLVLHVKDTRTGRRSEVRGKLGYETDGYDPNDKLHQLLDKVGRSASVSDMMNGDVVHINPRHPQGPSAKKAASAITSEKIQEAFDNPYPITWEYLNPTGASSGIVKLDDGSALDIHFSEEPAGVYEIEFARDGSNKQMGRSGQGDEFRVFATVQAAMLKWWKQLDKTSARKITFYANKQDGNRARLYKRFLKMWGDKSGWEIEVNAKSGLAAYSLTNPTPNKPKNGKKTFIQRVFGKKETNVQEAFDNPYPIKWLSLRPDSSSSAKAKLDDGSELEIHFADDDAGYYDIEFLRSGSMKVSGEGDEFRVFATVQAAILEWWKQADKKYVRAISFSADKGDNNRSKLYKRFAEMWAKKIKWQFKSDDGRRDVEFSLIRPKAVEENFAESDVPLGKYLFHVAYASGLTGMLRDGHLGEPDEYFSMTSDQKYIVSGNPEVQIVIDTARVSKMETFEKHVDDWESTPGAGDWAKGDNGDFESEYRVEETIPWDYVVAVKILKSKATKEIVQLAKQRGVKLVGKDNNITENFADGKKKGKSRPGRVKKSGASCNGSVTSLRKKAKAGGEKGRMYHWCANMKSGRKKK